MAFFYIRDFTKTKDSKKKLVGYMFFFSVFLASLIFPIQEKFEISV